MGIDKDSLNCIATVFHPDYTYGDFMGKLLPLTVEDRITYRFYPGFFLKALAVAYRNMINNIEWQHADAHQYSDWHEHMIVSPDNIINDLEPPPPLKGDVSDESLPPEPDAIHPFTFDSTDGKAIPPWDDASEIFQHVVLIIDEINRGNSSAIFGSVFQLLDRDSDGWSTTSINISDMEFSRLVTDIFGQETGYESLIRETELNFLLEKKIKLPPNLSILATMNTSDESIFYMDSAFKRRWEWQFIDIDGSSLDNDDGEAIIFGDSKSWREFVNALNLFIREHHQQIRGVEDKQIGYWFISQVPVTRGQIQNKLMFYLWDSVFRRDKEPPRNIVESSLVTFDDFARELEKFLAHFDVDIS